VVSREEVVNAVLVLEKEFGVGNQHLLLWQTAKELRNEFDALFHNVECSDSTIAAGAVAFQALSDARDQFENLGLLESRSRNAVMKLLKTADY